MQIFIMMSFLLSMMFLFTNSPLTLGLIIILQSLIIASTLLFHYQSSWLIYLVVMLFISGMMIIFTYISSLTPNKPLFTNINATFMLITMSILTTLILFSFTSTSSFNKPAFTLHSPSFMMLSPLYLPPLFTMSIFLIIFLLFIMIIVVKISNTASSPLRLKK